MNSNDIRKSNAAFNEALLCDQCVEDKQQKGLDLRNMADDEVGRNVDIVLFKPCDNCASQFEKNPEDDYQTYGRVDDGEQETNFMPSQSKKKLTHFRIKPREVTRYEFVSAKEAQLKRDKPDPNMSTEQFRQFIKDNYKIYKEDMSKLFYPDEDPKFESYAFYLLDYNWMDSWRKFIAGGAKPKMIDNKRLRNEIE